MYETMISITGLLTAVSLMLPNTGTSVPSPAAGMAPICWHVGTYYDEYRNGWEIIRCIYEDGTVLTWYDRKPTKRM